MRSGHPSVAHFGYGGAGRPLSPQQFSPSPCGFSRQEPRVPRDGNAAPPPLLFRSSARSRVTAGKARSVGRSRPSGRLRAGSAPGPRGERDPLGPERGPRLGTRGRGGATELLGRTRAAPGARAKAAPRAPCGAPGGRLCPRGGGQRPADGAAPRTRPCGAAPRLAAAAAPALSDPGAVPHSRRRFGRAAPLLS